MGYSIRNVNKTRDLYPKRVNSSSMTGSFSAKFEQLGQIRKHINTKQTSGVKYQSEISIMATTTCQEHAVKFVTTEQHSLIEIYGCFKHLIIKKTDK